MSENWPKILDVIGTVFLQAILCPFYMNGQQFFSLKMVFEIQIS